MKTVCAHVGCPEPVEDPTAPKITATSYCDEHKLLFELDQLDGSVNDVLDNEEEDR